MVNNWFLVKINKTLNFTLVLIMLDCDSFLKILNQTSNLIINSIRRKELIKQGKLFNSLEELVKEKYDNKGRIEKASNILLTYVNEEGNNSKLGYYTCPICGVVKGEPEEKKYNNINLLSGSRGVKYYCNICKMEIYMQEFSVS